VTRPRHRRHVPDALLLVLRPIYRYDDDRDAWILRIVGRRLGPVLRPNRYRRNAGALDDQTTGDGPATEDPVDPDTEPTTATITVPDPLPSPMQSPTRPRRATSDTQQQPAPPPLAIRRPPD
jgi:hypothetical protein